MPSLSVHPDAWPASRPEQSSTGRAHGHRSLLSQGVAELHPARPLPARVAEVQGEHASPQDRNFATCLSVWIIAGSVPILLQRCVEPCLKHSLAMGRRLPRRSSKPGPHAALCQPAAGGGQSSH